jgi:cytochrome c oxidase subunit 2
MNTPVTRRILPVLALACAVGSILSAMTILAAAGSTAALNKREVTLDAKKFAFSPATIDVFEGDVVQITLVPADIPHSFTVDAYKIAKRAEPGKPVTFEFLCNKAGTFRFYCNLTIDDGCKRMAGELIVRKK